MTTLQQERPPSISSHGQDVIAVGHHARVLLRAGHRLHVTPMELGLLEFLVAQRDVVHPREELLRRVWGWVSPDRSRTVDTHVARLRRKIGPVGRAIVTVHRVGYLLDSRSVEVVEHPGWTQVSPSCV